MTKRPPRSWFWKPPVEQEVDEELAFHLEMHTRDLIASGMSPAAAREKAQERLGDLYRLRRTCVSLGRKRNRMMHVTQLLDEIRDDVMVALRRLKQSPGFTLVAVLTLALGIGANSAIFALADAALLRPLPFPEADRLVMINEVRPSGNPTQIVGPYEMVQWQDRNRSLEAMTLLMSGKVVMTGGDGTGADVNNQVVSQQFFDTFRVRPIAGRTFNISDDGRNGDVAVLSERVWRSRFGGDPGILGRKVKLDNFSYTVIGIAPASFQVLAQSDVWTMLTTTFMRSPASLGHYVRVAARMKPGVTLAAAQADMTAAADAFAKERPDLNKDHGVLLQPLQQSLVGADLQLTAKVMLGVVAFVLLTCCANIANLVLARTSGRARELAVRSALGAGGRRIVRLLLTESLVLSAIAAALGAALGAAVLSAAPSLLPPGVLPVDVALKFDLRVLGFCAVAAFGLALAVGTFPAWQASRLQLLPALSAGSRSSTRGGSTFRSILAMSQVAAAVVVLCGAGLLLRSLNALMHVDPGHRGRESLTGLVTLPFVRSDAPPGTPYASVDARRQFFDAVEREVKSVPGVQKVTWASALPLDGWWIGYGFQREDDPRQRPEAQRDPAHVLHVGTAYFDTLGIPILAGRSFTDVDTESSPLVCIVNEALVRRYFGKDMPLGTRLVVRGMSTGGRVALPAREIVGVVGQVKERPDELNAEPQIYYPYRQDPPSRMTLVVQPTAGSASALTPAVRAAVARVDKERTISSVRTIATIGYEANAAPRFRAVVIGAFALLVLTLAVVGVFGVLAYSVQQRVREFGVRIALGATTSDVLAMVFGSTARMVGAGIAAGLMTAAALSRSMSALLFNVTPVDPVTFGVVALLLTLTGLLATAVPALRAARVDPIVALRDE